MKIVQNILIILCLFLFFISLKKEKSPLVSSFPISFFQIQSGSMMPEIQEKEVVVLWRKKQYEENDIITYQTKKNYYITHRIIKKEQEGYLTKGDFNSIQDQEVVTIEQIQGKVIFHSKLLALIYTYRFYWLMILLCLWLI